MQQVSLRVVRMAYGYTEEETAEYCEVSKETYDKYENDVGEIPASVATKIHTLFGVSLDALYIG